MSSSAIALRLWFLTWVTLAIGSGIMSMFLGEGLAAFSVCILVAIAACILSFPSLIILVPTVAYIQRSRLSINKKLFALGFLLLIISLLYGLTIVGLMSSGFSMSEDIERLGAITGILFACSCVAAALSHKHLTEYFSDHYLILPADTDYIL